MPDVGSGQERGSAVEGEGFERARLVGVGQLGGLAETTAPFGVLAGEQMPFPLPVAHDLAGPGDFEPFGDGFACFLVSGASHKTGWAVKGRGQ